jgi:hypothetical protein
MSTRAAVLLLCAICALAAYLRLDHLDSAPPGLYHDEAMNGIDCLMNLENRSLQVFYSANVGREGLYINVATLSVYCFGNRAWALRLPAAIFGVLTVLGVYLIAAELFSRPVALMAAFFVASSFWHVLLSRLGLRAIAAPVFLIFGCYLLLRGLRRAGAGLLWAGVPHLHRLSSDAAVDWRRVGAWFSGPAAAGPERSLLDRAIGVFGGRGAGLRSPGALFLAAPRGDIRPHVAGLGPQQSAPRMGDGVERMAHRPHVLRAR